MIPEIRPTDPRDPQAIALLQASHALMQDLFAPEDNHFLSIDALCGPGITFLGAYEGEGLLGCAALAARPGYGEVKSMFVDPDARGRGVAAALLDRLEAEARGRDLTVLRLETGDALVAAIRAYTRHGFAIRGPFGDYAANDSSVFMEKVLA